MSLALGNEQIISTPLVVDRKLVYPHVHVLPVLIIIRPFCTESMYFKYE